MANHISAEEANDMPKSVPDTPQSVSQVQLAPKSGEATTDSSQSIDTEEPTEPCGAPQCPPRFLFVDLILVLLFMIFDQIALSLQEPSNRIRGGSRPWFGQRTNRPYHKTSTVNILWVYFVGFCMLFYCCALDWWCASLSKRLRLLKCVYNVWAFFGATYITIGCFDSLKAATCEKRPNYKNSTDKKDRLNAFPSGHAALSALWPLLLFWCLRPNLLNGAYEDFIRKQWSADAPKRYRLLLACCGFMLVTAAAFAIFTAVSRITDYEHHSHDVIFGFLLTASVCGWFLPFSFRITFYGPVSRYIYPKGDERHLSALSLLTHRSLAFKGFARWIYQVILHCSPQRFPADA